MNAATRRQCGEEIIVLALAIMRYDPESGALVRTRTRGGRVAGSLVGAMREDGYLSVRINGVEILAHRLAWAMHYRCMPTEQIDHINGIKHDNRIVNLREVPRLANNQNRRGPNRNNRLGVHGVSKSRSGRYVARIRTNGKLKHLGTFCNPADAHNAFIDAKRRLHEGCTI